MGTKKMKLQLKIVFRINSPPTMQTSVNFRSFVELYLRSLKTSNLTIYLILRCFFPWRERIFPNWPMSKVEEKLEGSIQDVYERKHIGVDHKIARKILTLYNLFLKQTLASV